MDLRNGFNNLHIENSHSGRLKGLQWRVALISDSQKYLTAESFGCKINVTGVAAKKKQIWRLEYDPKEEGVVYLKSHLDRYMSGDLKGNATCEAEEAGEMEGFTLSYRADGRWAFRNKKSGYYLGCASQEVKCNEKSAERNEWWVPQLFCHPHICMRNLGRQKFISLEEDSFRLTSVTPWGVKSILSLEFHEGRYRLKGCDGRYLCKDGTLTNKADSNGDLCSFNLELKTGALAGVAFKDSSSKYLAGVGKEAVVQAKGGSLGRDEVFSVEHVHLQVVITAPNAKMISIKQGVDPTANQDEEVTEKELFQVEYAERGLWRIMSSDENYWTVESNNRIQASSCKRTDAGLFELCWSEKGGVFIRSPTNNKYLACRMNGSLLATSDEASEKERFVMTLVNRSEMAFRCDYGFLGVKTSTSTLECNHTTAHLYSLQHTNGKEAHYFLKSSGGKYIRVERSGHVTASADEGSEFLLEFRDAYRVVVRMVGGKYLVGEQNGLLLAKTADVDEATVWEI